VPIHSDVHVYSGRRLTCVNTQLAQITVAANSLAVTNRLRLHEYRASWYLDNSTAQNANPFCKALYNYVHGQNTNKTITSLTRNVYKKDKRRRIKKRKKKYNTSVLTPMTEKLRMIIVKDQTLNQWTTMFANFVRKLVMSSNSIKKNYYLCNDRQRQEKLANVDNNKYNVFITFLMFQVLI